MKREWKRKLRCSCPYGSDLPTWPDRTDRDHFGPALLSHYLYGIPTSGYQSHLSIQQTPPIRHPWWWWGSFWSLGRVAVPAVTRECRDEKFGHTMPRRSHLITTVTTQPEPASLSANFSYLHDVWCNWFSTSNSISPSPMGPIHAGRWVSSQSGEVDRAPTTTTTTTTP